MGVVTDQAGNIMSTAWTRMKQAAGAYLGLNLAKQIATVRGQFQQLEVAFTTMLGSKEKADRLMAEVVDTAAKTPFDLQGVTNGAKQLLAYGVASEKVNETLIRLGNISAGLSIPLGDLVYLYGTTMTQGRLFTQDLRQFMGRGIPLADELAKQFGVTKDKVGELVTAGKVGFPEVQKAIEAMTNQGGKFYDLMEEQSKTITGQISNLGDAIQTMFNEIGKSNEGAINTVLDGAQWMVENYKTLLNILTPLVATYGTYKVALMAVAAAQKISLLATQVAEYLKMAKALGIATANQIAFNTAVKANPYILAASAIMGVVTALISFSDTTDKASNSLDEFNKKLDESKVKIDERISVIQDDTQPSAAQMRAYDELRKIIPALTDAYSLLQLKTLDLAKAQKVVNQSQEEERYKHLTENVKKYSGELDRLRQQYDNLSKYDRNSAGKAVYLSRQIDATTSVLEQAKKDLAEYERLRRDAEKQAQPIQTQLIEAKANLDQIDQEFEKVDKKIKEERAKLKEGETLQLPLILQIQYDFLLDQKDAAERNYKQLEQAAKLDPNANYGELYANARKEWESAKNELRKIERDKDAFSKEQYDNAKEREKETKETYAALGGITTSPKKDNKADKALKEYEAAQKEYNDFVIDQQKKLNDEQESLERSRITNKVELIEYDRQKTVEAIEEEQAAYLKLVDAYNKLARAQGKPIVSADISVFTRRRNAANGIADNALTEAMQDEMNAFNEYLAEYGTYQEKRLGITQLYADKIAKAQSEGEKMSLQKEQEKILQNLDASMLQQTTFWTRLFKDADTLATSSINKIIDDTERLLEYIDQVKGGQTGDTSILDSLGLSKEQIDAVIADPEKLKAMLGALKTKRDALNTRNPFGQLIQGFKDLKDAAGDADKQMAAINKIIAGAQGASQIIGDLGDSMTELGDAIGSDFVSGFGNALSDISDVANQAISGAMAGAAVGGPIGAAIGAGVGLLTGVISGIGKRLAYNNKIRQEYLAQLQKEYLAEFEINALYRERYDWAQKIGETTLAYLNRNSRELDRQAKANAKEQDELWAKLMGSEYVSSERYKHGTWFSKAKVIKGYSTLEGKSWDEIELLATQGKLTDEAYGYYEALKKAREEGEDLDERLEQLAEETREAFTGIGFNGLVDSIVDGFKEGKRSAADFADNFEELMSNAVIQSLKMNALEAPLRKWYEDFAAAASDKDGLTAQEIKELKAKYENILSGAANQLEQLESITGVSVGNAESLTQQATSSGYETLSQDTGNAIEGRATAIQEYVSQINDKMTDIGMKVTTVGDVLKSQDQRLLSIQNSGFEIQGLIATSINYFKTMDKNLAFLPSVADSLNKIAKNTAKL